MSRKRVCECRPNRIRGYVEKVSGPLLDRIDMRLEVQSVPGAELLAAGSRRRDNGGGTVELRRAVTAANQFRVQQGRRTVNCALEWRDRDTWAPLTSTAGRLLRDTADELDLSTRSLTRVLRLARTVADLEPQEELDERHILEALEYHSPRGGGSFLRWLAAH